MPYVFYEELPENVEEAEVVSQSEYDELKQLADDLADQRDKAIERAEVAEEGWKKTREKYANTFLTTPARVKQENSGKSDTLSAQSIHSLFTNK